MIEALFYITGTLSVALLTLILGRHEKLGEAISQVEAFKRENAELKQELKKEEQDRDHLLRQLAANYDSRVEGEQKKVEEFRLSHEEWKSLAIYCVKAVERLKPGWIWDRMEGKPEKILVITEPNKLTGVAAVKAAMKRPAPPPRSPIGEVKTPPPEPPKPESPGSNVIEW